MESTDWRRLARRRALELNLRPVRDVERTGSPWRTAPVLGDDALVLHGHLPTGEGHHACPERYVLGMEGRPAQRFHAPDANRLPLRAGLSALGVPEERGDVEDFLRDVEVLLHPGGGHELRLAGPCAIAAGSPLAAALLAEPRRDHRHAELVVHRLVDQGRDLRGHPRPEDRLARRTNVGPIGEVAAKDDGTVVFKLSAPFADLPVTLAYTNAKIVPAAIASGGLDAARRARRSAPARSSSCPTSRTRQIVVERNEAYYDKARPYLDRIEVVVYPDATAEASALIAGDTDLMSTTPADRVRPLQRAPPASTRCARRPDSSCNVNMGCDQKPFSDVRVRQALALTVDREAMVDFVAEGFGTPGNDTPMNAAYRFYKELPRQEAGHRQGQAAARRRRLSRTGIDATLIASDTPGHAHASSPSRCARWPSPPASASTCRPCRTRPISTRCGRRARSMSASTTCRRRPTRIFSLLYTCNAAWNETRWNNAEFDKLVAEAPRHDRRGQARASSMARRRR